MMVYAAEDGPKQSSGNLFNMLLPFLAIGFLFYFLLIRPQRREQARRQALLAAVKKNDRVLTAGGIFGMVTNVHAEADEVTVKVDEATNTKLRVTLSSIARVMGDEPSDDKSTGR
ncbi:MAG: preprotein translocase subunit YajC [Planctomycetes bacterium RBG_13_63_9]|nr:MAG: preprotein translocase subunit YajC [Planctomycetes bacterium RBG_13_63_9]